MRSTFARVRADKLPRKGKLVKRPAALGLYDIGGGERCHPARKTAPLIHGGIPLLTYILAKVTEGKLQKKIAP